MSEHAGRSQRGHDTDGSMGRGSGESSGGEVPSTEPEGGGTTGSLERTTEADFRPGGRFEDVSLSVDAEYPVDPRGTAYPDLFGSGWGEVLASVGGVDARQNRLASANDLIRLQNFDNYLVARGEGNISVPASHTSDGTTTRGTYGLRYQCVEFANRYGRSVRGMPDGQWKNGGMFGELASDAACHGGSFDVAYGRPTEWRPADGDAVYRAGNPGHVGILSASGLTADADAAVAESETYSVSVYQQNLLPAVDPGTLSREGGRWTLTTGTGGWSGYVGIAEGRFPAADALEAARERLASSGDESGSGDAESEDESASAEPEASAELTHTLGTAHAQVGTLRVRASATTASAQVGAVGPSQSLEVLAVDPTGMEVANGEGTWLQIRLPAGSGEGWVYAPMTDWPAGQSAGQSAEPETVTPAEAASEVEGESGTETSSELEETAVRSAGSGGAGQDSAPLESDGGEPATVTSGRLPQVLVYKSATEQRWYSWVLHTGDAVVILQAPDASATRVQVTVPGRELTGEAWIEKTMLIPASTVPPEVVAMPEVGTELAALMALERLDAAQLAEARTLIAAVPDAAARGNLYERLQDKVEYANQRDNESWDGEAADGMCNLTSLAMCLQLLGIPNPDPEKQYEDALETIRHEQGFADRTDAKGWSAVAEHLGVSTTFLSQGAQGLARPFWFETVRPVLRSGQSVMLSVTGHIVRLQAVSPDGLVLDDPWGALDLGASGHSWSESNSREGDGGAHGEDHVVPWEQVEAHSFLWVAAFAT